MRILFLCVWARRRPPSSSPLPRADLWPCVRSGLDNAGKTTILKQLNGEDIKTVSPTLGFEIRTFLHKGSVRLRLPHSASGRVVQAVEADCDVPCKPPRPATRSTSVSVTGSVSQILCSCDADFPPDRSHRGRRRSTHAAAVLAQLL
jgi:hypothetical protein